MWGVQNNLNLSHNHEKVCQDYHSFENNPFYHFGSFLGVFDIPEGFFEILIVSDWFNQVHKVPWHVRILEHIEFLQKPWKKCVKTVITVSLKSSLSMISAISYPYMWEA